MKKTLILSIAFAGCLCARAADDYKLGADSLPQAGVPRGELIAMPAFSSSTNYPGTTRDWSVYVPRQYDAAKPARLMVFFDGGGYAGTNGSFRVPVVFDNLIHKKELPVVIGLFVSPGNIPGAEPGAKGRSNRSYEYDSTGGRNARLLIEELLPLVDKRWNITKDPAGRAVAGISSGGIAAFTVAWERPDQFGKVLSHIGSFTNIRSGHVYPALIRASKDKPKALRVFLQEGSTDLDNLHGHWPLANQDMAAALKFAAYDHKFVMGTEGHSGKQGGAILPDSLRWLWRDDPKN